MGDIDDPRAIGRRVEGLLADVSALEDGRARAKAEELVRALMELYGAGLTRLLEIVDGDDEAAARLFGRFGDDDLVGSLLVLHGLHPLGTEERVGRALERVRPYLGSHGGDVRLLGVSEGVVRLQLEGSCHGCPSSAITMRTAIERAIAEAAPEVARIDVEGLTAAAPANPLPQPTGPLLQIENRLARAETREATA